MKSAIKTPVLFLLLILTLSGCSDKRYNLTLSQPKTDFKQPGKVLIVTQDKRPFVVDGEKSSAYVGKWFAGNGIPIKVTTRSSKGVAEEIGLKINASLSDNGFYISTSAVPPKGDFDILDPIFRSSEYDRVVFLTVDMFKAESFMEVDLQWGFHLQVYDDKGVLLAQAENTGVEEGLRRNYTGAISTGQAQSAINTQTDVILAELLSTADVRHALDIQNSKMVPAIDENGKITIEGDGTAETADIIALRKQLNSAEISVLRKQLTLDDKDQFETSAKDICRKGVIDEKELDHLAEIIWDNRNSNDRKIVNGLCYLCKIFIKNKNPRYKMFFEELRTKAKTRKLRKYAIKTIRILSPGIVEQFKPEADVDPLITQDKIKGLDIGKIPSDFEKQLPPPDDGFEWQMHKDAIVMLPPTWFKHQAKGQLRIDDTIVPISSYAGSPTDFSESKMFEMGFTIQAMKDLPKDAKITPGELALFYLKPFIDSHQKKDIIIFNQEEKGNLEYTYFRYKDAPSGLTPIIVHKFVIANNEEHWIYAFTFESPESTWALNWEKYGVPILQKIILTETINNRISMKHFQ